MKFALLFVISAMASGLLFCLALPPADQWHLGWVAFVPLLAVTRRRGFLLGFVGGILALFTTAFLVKSGLLYSSKHIGGEDGWITTGCGLFGFVVSLVIAFWADKGSTKPTWWFASLAVLLEMCLLIVLPAHLALTQYRQPLMLTLASVTGIWGVSFLLWWSNCAVAQMLERREYRKLAWPGAIVLLTGLSQLLPVTRYTDGLPLGIVQSDKIDVEPLSRLHQQASATVDTVVVWPEFAGLGIAIGGDTEPLQKIVRDTKGGYIVTSYNDRFAPKPHNVASLVSADATSAEYFKQKLFGGEKQMHTPGSQPQYADSVRGRVALAICFDSCYPAIVREAARQPKVVAMALPTIDPESPNHFVAAIHGAFTPFRAAENGIPIARADGFAYSMIVDSKGRILEEILLGEGTKAAVASPPINTIYRRIGDWFLYFSGATFVFGIIVFRKSKGSFHLSDEKNPAED